jgi:hypothetical protein
MTHLYLESGGRANYMEIHPKSSQATNLKLLLQEDEVYLCLHPTLWI